MKRKNLKRMAALLFVLQLSGTTVFAQTNGYGAGYGREDAANINDYSTNSWDRFTFNYQFETGVDYSEELGKPTYTDVAPRNEAQENIRRNKDVALIPPPYGVFSGEYATEASNIFITANNNEYAKETSSSINLSTYDTMGIGVNSESGILTPTSIGASGSSGNVTTNAASGSQSSNVSVSTSNVSLNSSSTPVTESIVYSDGSIGKLSIPKLGLTVKVYEGETLNSMAKGIGHFEFTSNWDGNIGLAGHNGGSAGYFENLKNLSNGDKFVYETKYGTRAYELVSKQTISDTDYSLLGWSDENILTMITCVKGVSNQRLAVIAVEI